MKKLLVGIGAVLLVVLAFAFAPVVLLVQNISYGMLRRHVLCMAFGGWYRTSLVLELGTMSVFNAFSVPLRWYARKHMLESESHVKGLEASIQNYFEAVLSKIEMLDLEES